MCLARSLAGNPQCWRNVFSWKGAYSAIEYCVFQVGSAGMPSGISVGNCGEERMGVGV